MKNICDPLLQNPEQGTFWRIWVFGFIKKSRPSAFIWYQNHCNSPYTSRDMTFRISGCYWFSGKCNNEKSAFKVSVPFQKGGRWLTKCMILGLKSILFSKKTNWHDRRDMKESKYIKISKSIDESFFTPFQLRLAVSQNYPVRLVPGFEGAGHIFDSWTYFFQICFEA